MYDKNILKKPHKTFHFFYFLEEQNFNPDTQIFNEGISASVSHVTCDDQK